MEKKNIYVSTFPSRPTPKLSMNTGTSHFPQYPVSFVKALCLNGRMLTLPPLLDCRQFGNIKSTTTVHCLISLFDYIYKRLEKRKTAATLIFVDY